MATKGRVQAGNVCNVRWLLLLFGLVVFAAWQLLLLHRTNFAIQIPAAGASLISGLNTLEAEAAEAVHPDGRVDLLLRQKDPKVVISSLQHDLAEKSAENQKLKAELEQAKLKAEALTNLAKLKAAAEKPHDSQGAGDAPLAPKTVATPSLPASSRPYYDIVAFIMTTASHVDAQRMELAEQTWLSWHAKYTSDLTMTHVFALCQGDPGTDCKGDNCAINRPHVVVLPCKHSYAALIGKSSAGYRYVAANFNFSYLLKADVDSIMDVVCAIRKIRAIPPKCKSWGLGLWRIARDSKVFGDEPGAGKYANPAYLKDTGNDWYPPYMTGWAFIWSGDVARFLGMAGLPEQQMPTWRDTWTIEDAAIGTFVAGLDVCHISLAGVCPIWTDMVPADYHLRDLIIAKAEEDKVAEAIEVGENGEIAHLEKHRDNNIPVLGDLVHIQAKSLKHCAARCFLNQHCRSFSYSPTQTEDKKAKITSCLLHTRKWPRTGKKFRDFTLYIRLDV